MIRLVLAFTLSMIAVASLGAQESRPKAKLPKKWSDGLAKPVAPATDGVGAVYGGASKVTKVVPLAKAAKEMKDVPQPEIRVRGTITSICSKKGCWMRVRDDEQELFVKFLDYGFFVPRQVVGHEVELEGTLSVEVTTEAERRHYAEDAGKSPEEIAQIHGDESQLRMLASSVTIREPKVTSSIAIQIGTKLDAPDLPGWAEVRDGERYRLRGISQRFDPKGRWFETRVNEVTVRVVFPIDCGEAARHLGTDPVRLHASGQIEKTPTGWQFLAEGGKVYVSLSSTKSNPVESDH